MSGKIKAGQYGSGQVIISGLSEKEVAEIMGAINHGHNYIKVEDDKLKTVAKFEDLPGPISDEEMLPFWRPVTKEEKNQNLLDVPGKIINYGKDKISSPAINIEYLCGKYYSPEDYKINAEKLESYGFICFRSRRLDDGTYSEIWHLPSLGSAKGKLAEFIKAISVPAGGKIWENKFEEKKLDGAIDFINENVKYGILDVTITKLYLLS
jgi:hypothetical protein